MEIRIILLGLFFLIMIISGLWLTRTGKPYPFVPFNIHKLAALITVILSVVILFYVNKTTRFNTLEWELLTGLGVLVVLSFVSSAFLSLERSVHPLFLFIHRYIPIVLTALAAWVIYLLILKNR
jgi:hypothetical protein